MENKTAEKRYTDIKAIHSCTFRTVFGKGFVPWLRLVMVGFLFSFLGISNTSQTGFINLADSFLGLENEFLPNNAGIVKDILDHFTASSDLDINISGILSTLIDVLSRSHTWLIKLLGANLAYVERNPGEVIAWLLAAGVIAFVIRYVIQNVLIAGQLRYCMENRFAKEVRPGRVLAPFHRKNILNMMRVMFIYRVVMILWGLTVIGGVYKYYQYCMVPLILSENPDISWRDAKRLSKRMTDGDKFRIFLVDVSYLYLFLLEVIPVAGILVFVPLMTQLDAEIYFRLREKITDEDRRFLIETGFDRPAYVDEPGEAPEYLMKEHFLEKHEEVMKKKYYLLTDYIFMFFAFCVTGWLWEVCLHLVQHQEFVNRGTMYGPWLPIYGTGGVLMILLLNRFRKNRVKMITLMILLCGVLEYMGSFILDFIYNRSYWDYRTMFLNLNGRICLAGLIAFAIGGCFGVYVAGPRLRRFMHSLSRKKQIMICAVLILVFAADMVCCTVFGFNSGSGVGESLAALIMNVF